ncbi:MAG: GxxExxY protein [Gemmatimonadetes bacterium]|nr:GxxExxY protein [Gemmatimonadota bacterium]
MSIPRVPLLYADISSVLLKSFYEVHNELGHGFLEAIYRKALVRAMAANGLKCAQEVPLKVRFRNEVIGHYQADVIVEEKIIVELKITSHIEKAHEAQLVNYLRATDYRLGFLLLFGPTPAFRRKINTNRVVSDDQP